MAQEVFHSDLSLKSLNIVHIDQRVSIGVDVEHKLMPLLIVETLNACCSDAVGWIVIKRDGNVLALDISITRPSVTVRIYFDVQPLEWFGVVL
ncbi:MAG: hypothetical protein AAFS10_24595 [Myxococcota bacterium]